MIYSSTSMEGVRQLVISPSVCISQVHAFYLCCRKFALHYKYFSYAAFFVCLFVSWFLMSTLIPSALRKQEIDRNNKILTLIIRDTMITWENCHVYGRRQWNWVSGFGLSFRWCWCTSHLLVCLVTVLP